MHEEEKWFSLSGKIFKEGDKISLDGSTGNIYDIAIKTVPADPNSGYFGRIMKGN
jgi:pyruvate,orthophosphate dikinase